MSTSGTQPSRKFYIDVGANRGDTIRGFYAKAVVDDTNNKKVKLPYDYNPNDWKVVAFEADPIQTETLKKLQSQLNFELHAETAVWINDGGITLYPDRHSKTGFVGSSISQVKSGVRSDKPIQVASINFSRWLQKHVIDSDFVVLKMNIEGAEVEVLNKLLHDGTFCLIDQLFVFYHAKLAFHGENKLANKIPEMVFDRSVQPDCFVQILYSAETFEKNSCERKCYAL
ncbi:uncharacterized protein [Ptychodera flava]|uniref:uncharacterized protein n=1 Tax=Ptychodera flava TaxID=63121 RepID=UPI00396A5BB7